MTTELLSVGIDVTPLLGPPTGIPAVTRGLVSALAMRDDIALSGWILSSRGAKPELPSGTICMNRRFPAGLIHRLWAHATIPPGPMITGRVDVVHGTNYVVPPGAAAVLTIQDLSPISHTEWTGPGIARMGTVARRAVELGAVVHVPCRRVAIEAREFLGVAEERLRIIHNAIGSTSSGDPQTGRRLAGTDNYVLALGTVGRRKCLPTLVDAMRSLPGDVGLVVAGPVGDDEANVADSVRRVGLGDRYRRITDLQESGRNDLLSAASVLAYPSLYEGYGLPPLEALVAGIPVVATDVGALDELVGDDIELVPVGNPSAFAEALSAMMSNPATPTSELRDRLSGFTWDAAAEALVSAYRLAAG